MARSSSNEGVGILAGAIVMAAIIAAIVWFNFWAAEKGCHARWSGSGMESSFIIPGECRVRMANGAWLPERAIRDINISK